ncbi:LytTR family transcriptional regulator [Spirosoma sp. HMF4905]|uniref:LytTR family transcriptional regulator n=1 Tax=Spirosoma arboris TaxID=2682092 RepID=A0A7K1SIE0_9BACT|nr:LytTR family DNA-binding domain-containing protein [Spirosoma arboris]MVM33591.1 LytTR family transcriptional regulator [Spirosoma arboris]
MKQLFAAQVQHKFDPEKVLYLTGEVNYSTVYLLTGQAVLTSRTLKWYSDRWPQFMRVHKGSLVNPEYIHSCIVISSEVAHLIMRNGARLLIGRRRIKAVAYQLGLNLPEKRLASTHLIKPEWDCFVPAHAKFA